MAKPSRNTKRPRSGLSVRLRNGVLEVELGNTKRPLWGRVYEKFELDAALENQAKIYEDRIKAGLAVVLDERDSVVARRAGDVVCHVLKVMGYGAEHMAVLFQNPDLFGTFEAMSAEGARYLAAHSDTLDALIPRPNAIGRDRVDLFERAAHAGAGAMQSRIIDALPAFVRAAPIDEVMGDDALAYSMAVHLACLVKGFRPSDVVERGDAALLDEEPD